MHRENLDGDHIFVIHDFLTAEECRTLIDRTEAEGYADAPISTAGGFVMAKEVRDNTRVMIDDPTLAEMLWLRAQPFLPISLDGWEAVGFNERFRSYRYDPGQRFKPHFDGWYRRENGERSRLTFMVYLNESCDGGETRFLPQDGPHLAVRPESGKALVFLHALLHEGAPVLSGRKYALRTDVMYRRPPA